MHVFLYKSLATITLRVSSNVCVQGDHTFGSVHKVPTCATIQSSELFSCL